MAGSGDFFREYGQGKPCWFDLRFVWANSEPYQDLRGSAFYTEGKAFVKSRWEQTENVYGTERPLST